MPGEPEVLYEASELGPVALHRGVVYVAEADPAIPIKRESVRERLEPTLRWRLTEIDPKTRTRRPVFHEPTESIDRLVVDDAGVVLFGRRIRLLDHERSAPHVAELDAHVDCGVGASRYLVVFVNRRPGRDDLICVADRRSGRVQRGVVHVEGTVRAITADDTVLAWAPDFESAIYVARFDRSSSALRIALTDRVLALASCEGKILAGAARRASIIDGAQVAQHTLTGPLSIAIGCTGRWLGAIPSTYGTTIVAIGSTVETVYASMGAVLSLAADEHSVAFVERVGDRPCRLLTLSTRA